MPSGGGRGRRGDGSPLHFYEWRRDSGDSLKTYYTDGVYLPQTPGKNDLNDELTSHNGTAYTVYNRSDTAREVVVPGLPVPLSGTLWKQASESGWSVAIRASCGQGAMAPVYCGYIEGGKGSVTYPVPPSWNGVTVNVYDKSRGSTCGGMLVRELPDSGYTYEIVFDNTMHVKEKITYRLDRLHVSDNNTMIGIIDPETGAISPSEDSLVIEVDPHSRAYRWLAIGSADYFTTLKQMPFRGQFRLLHTLPNPFKQSLRIGYQIPYGGIEWIRCEVFDPRGKLLWKLQVGPRLHPGENEIVWSPRKERPMAAGAYIIRLSGFDGRNRIIGKRITRVTYLP